MPLQENKSIEIDLVKCFVQSIALPSKVHGLSHWERVERNGMVLSQVTGANVVVVRLFAYLHDSCRLNDSRDPDHGKRATTMIQSLRNDLLSQLTENEFTQLTFACENHSQLLRCEDVTVNSCFDADRLDLSRVGITPQAARMATKFGQHLAENFADYIVSKHTKI